MLNNIFYFLETALQGPLKDMPLAVRQQHGSSAPWQEVTYPGRWIGRRRPITWPSVAGSNSDGFFPFGAPEGARLSIPCQDYGRSRGSISSSCENGRCQRVKVCGAL
jgi:hypothetical protein